MRGEDDIIVCGKFPVVDAAAHFGKHALRLALMAGDDKQAFVFAAFVDFS